jgi:hypothetical protein
LPDQLAAPGPDNAPGRKTFTLDYTFEGRRYFIGDCP